jgi:hypothetical protein
MLNFWIALSGLGACVGGVIAVVGSFAIWLSAPQAVHPFGWTIVLAVAAISLLTFAVMAPGLWMSLSSLRSSRRFPL